MTGMQSDQYSVSRGATGFSQRADENPFSFLPGDPDTDH
jgi:hypothetical protein